MVVCGVSSLSIIPAYQKVNEALKDQVLNSQL